jgi:predicted nucleotidyltransferase component of viral defense system
MNNLISNFPQIISYAKQLSVPLNSQRAIVREYLQSMAISTIYAMPESKKLAFVGGTALRLLRDIDRFSEDLDFDNLGLSSIEFSTIMTNLKNRFVRENIKVELKETNKGSKQYYELRFPNLLFDLKITTNDKEKLMIKIDQSTSWKGQVPEVVLFSKYGFLEHVTSNPLNQLMVQKLNAYVERKQTQPRDMYDVVWLYSKGARIDRKFAKSNNLGRISQKAIEKFQTEGITSLMERRLQPFLFETNLNRKLSLFESVLQELDKQS